MPDPTYLIEIEFSSGVWMDITADCAHINVSRKSASAEQSLSVGQTNILLRNETGKYSPENTGSPYYPNLKPYKAIRIKAAHNNINYWLFTGIIDSYSVNVERGNRTCLISASDRLKLLQNRSITLPVKIDINAGTLFGDVLDEAGIPAADRVIDTFYDTIPFAWFRDRRPIEIMNDLLVYGNYRIYITPDGKLNIKNRYWGLIGTSVATYSDCMEFDYAIGEDGIANYIKVSGRPRRKAASVAVVANLEGTPAINPGITLTFWLAYYDPDNKAPDTPATEMVTPVMTTDYTANTAADGSGADKTGQITVLVTFFSASAKIQITNNDAGIIYLTSFKIRGKSIQEQSLISYVTENASSQNTYGKRDYVIESDYISTLLYAQDYGDFILSMKKDPHPAVRLAIKNIWPDCLTRELGDIVILNESISSVSGKWIIREIEHDIIAAEGLEHVIRLVMEQWIDLGYLILDDATRGKLDSGKLGF